MKRRQGFDIFAVVGRGGWMFVFFKCGGFGITNSKEGRGGRLLIFAAKKKEEAGC